MSQVEQFQASRVFLAGVYADTAVKLAQAVKDNPTSNLWSEYNACMAAWGALVDIENVLRGMVVAGDPIDDFYREGAQDG